MDHTDQEKTLMRPTEQPPNVGFITPEDQPPPYSSLLPPTQPTAPPPVETTQPPVHTTNVIYMVGQPQFGSDPVTMGCPYCQSIITSEIDQVPSTKTHLMCLLLCLLGCCCCAPLVYCTDGCVAKRHTCPNCHQFLGLHDGF